MAGDDEEDFDALSPEEALRAALRRSRAAAEQRRDPARPVPEHDEAAAAEPGPEDVAARTPMIDRNGQADDSGRLRLRRNGGWSGVVGNPFAAAPPVLPRLDSGAGMGFEIDLPGRTGRRR